MEVRDWPLEYVDSKKPWTAYHPRFLDKSGILLDLGCGDWEFSKFFTKRKRVVGIDPVPTQTPEGATYFDGLVGVVSGLVRVDETGKWICPHSKGTTEEEMYQIQDLLDLTSEKEISLLRMNLEGGEYEILINLSSPIADQIVVSFHHFTGKFRKEATDCIINYLSIWYDYTLIYPITDWYLFLRREL